jgi:hypothetical protein
MSEEFVRGFYEELEKIAAISDYLDPKTLGGAAIGAGLGATAGGIGGYYAGEQMQPGAGGKGALIGALGGGALGGVGGGFAGHQLAARDYASQMAEQAGNARAVGGATGVLRKAQGLRAQMSAVPGAGQAAKGYAAGAAIPAQIAQAEQHAQGMYDLGKQIPTIDAFRGLSEMTAEKALKKSKVMQTQAAQQAAQYAANKQKQQSIASLQALLQSQSGGAA